MSIASLVRRLLGLRIVTGAVLAALVGWFALTAVVGRLPGGWFVAASVGGLLLFVVSVLRLAWLTMGASPPAALRPLAPHAERLVFLVVLNLVILSPLAPLFEAIAQGPAASVPDPVTRQAFVALSKLTGPMLVAVLGAGALMVGWALVIRLLQPLLRLPGVPRLAGALDRLVVAAIVLFSTGAIVLSYNASLDRGTATSWRADLVALSGVRVPFTESMLGWADVRYVDRPDRVERILLKPDDGIWPERAAPGLPVQMEMGPGFLGIPWVQRVAVDRERDLRRALAAVPTAAALRKVLVTWLAQQRRWNDVRAETEAHFRACPEDRQFVLDVTAGLRRDGQAAHAVALEHMVSKP